MIITLSHQKGGVGKSTLVWNLAIEYSKQRKVYVIDLDMQQTFTQSLLIRHNNIKEGKLEKKLAKYSDNLNLIEIKDKEQ